MQCANPQEYLLYLTLPRILDILLWVLDLNTLEFTRVFNKERCIFMRGEAVLYINPQYLLNKVSGSCCLSRYPIS